MNLKKNIKKTATILGVKIQKKDDLLLVILSGELTSKVPQVAWDPLESFIKEVNVSGKQEYVTVTFDFSALTRVDLTGLAQFFDWENRFSKVNIKASIVGMSAATTELFDLAQEALKKSDPPSKKAKPNFIEVLGEQAQILITDFKEIVTFFGDLCVKLAEIIIKPKNLRIRPTVYILETAGINALPIVLLVSFLVGLVLAFQAAMPMKMFRAEIFVADLISLSLVRELAPLLTAIILAGRSGSAFAAELGSMKAGQEIDALITMGLDPVRYLVVSRVVGLALITPFITLMASFVGIIGGNIVMLLLNYSHSVYWDRVLSAVSLTSIGTGLFKAFFFGMIVAAIGCQRGLAVSGGPESVGEATTKSVVTNIVLIAIFDSIFAVTFYVLDI